MYFSPCACAGDGCKFWDGSDCKREVITKLLATLRRKL